MKKIGIVLTALVISMFMVGTVAAMNEIPKPWQEQYFTEHSSAQGNGAVYISKIVLDKRIAIDVEETMEGFTGYNGSFAMTTTEKLNESANVTANASADDCGTVNYLGKKMIQYEGDEWQGAYLSSSTKYETPRFHGGTGASVTEMFNVSAMQKDETTFIKTTAAAPKGGIHAKPVRKNALNFDTMNDFSGLWGTHSVWRKPCEKHIEHTQSFLGDFQVMKNLIFEEDVINCTGKNKGGC